MTTTMDDLIRGYGDWIMRECVNGRLPYYINIMFHPLSGLSPSSIIPQIHNAIYNNFYPRAPRKIAAPPRTPQNRLRMILLRSRFDSWTFTPMMSAIDSESNFSRCPLGKTEHRPLFCQVLKTTEASGKSRSTFVDATLPPDECGQGLDAHLVFHRVPHHARPLGSRSLVDL